MGLCASTATKEPLEQLEAAEQKNAAVNDFLADDEAQDSTIFKLLLLGAGESGKSTLFKQMKSLYVEPELSEAAKKKHETVIYQNVIEAMQHLIEGIPLVEEKKGITITTKVSKEMEGIRNIATNQIKDPSFTPEIGNMFLKVWEDEGIQKCYEHRNCYQLIDSAEYFFSRIGKNGVLAPDGLTMEDYIPTQEDVLRARVRTSGIVELFFQFEANEFRIFDVGGQRNERKKWIHCFDGVTAVLFVGVLSEYDLQLWEDENTNRMVETLSLFREHVNSRWFAKTSIVLFLNKRDIFEAKIEHVPLTECKELWREGTVKRRIDEGEFGWVDIDSPGFYTEPSKFAAGCERIKEQFYDQFDTPPNAMEQYCHLTSAIDKDHFGNIFSAVRGIILRQGLAAAGLLKYN